MKALAIAVGVVAVMFGVLAVKDMSTITVVNQEPQVIKEEVHPDWATDEDAVKAAQDVIKRKELEAELEVVQNEINSLVEKRKTLETELEQY